MRRFSIQSLLVAFILLFSLSLSAQKLMVESFVHVPDDATAMDEKYQRVDNNGNLAGLVKVIIPQNGVVLDGGMVLEQRKWAMGEYWVWMADGATKLTVRAPGYQALEVNFRDYEFKMLHGKNTYKLLVNVPVLAGKSQDDGQGFIAMIVEPKNSTLTINGVGQPLQDGQYSSLVDKGTYSYEVSAAGYAPQSGTIVVDDDTQPLTIHLESTMSTVVVSCATADAQIYLDNQLRGSAPLTLMLAQGVPHRIEARLQGFRSYKEDITVGEKENRRLDIPALERLTGSLRVNYMPIGSDVYVDGSKVGTNPGTFRNIGVGSHKVEILKEGYTSASVTTTVKENETAELSGSLTAINSPVDNKITSTVQSETNITPDQLGKTLLDHFSNRLKEGISGRVIDSDGEPLVGATIVVKDKPIAKVADIDGNFTIDCKEGDILVIQFVGHKTKKVKAYDGMVVKLR